MKFTIAVHGAPYGSFANERALKFCQACVASGHEIVRVFFYHEAVLSGLNSTVPPQDEIDVTQAWADFADTHQTELAVCIANGIKRGVLSDTEQARYDKPSPTLAQPFELVGLGQLIDAMASSDRYVEFPA
ncbi:MAG: sulfurtransferase complex subunit TusD [Pseudomonadota bacterium]